MLANSWGALLSPCGATSTMPVKRSAALPGMSATFCPSPPITSPAPLPTPWATSSAPLPIVVAASAMAGPAACAAPTTPWPTAVAAPAMPCASPAPSPARNAMVSPHPIKLGGLSMPLTPCAMACPQLKGSQVFVCRTRFSGEPARLRS